APTAPKAPAATSGSPTQPASAPQQPQAASPEAPRPAVRGKDDHSVDSLIDRALEETGTPSLTLGRGSNPSAAAPAGVPLAPSREDVTRTMTVLLPAIRGCAGGESGLATLGIVVRNDGHVENVTVSGAPFEGARSGRCMEGVVRKAKFPRFQQSSFRVQFPFQIQ
ncbi:MAG TPA: hypothetical protein VJV78_00110, partial [Polyangiales bacterium]|nr:hypothetical protein [Polyangiales bacterium]